MAGKNKNNRKKGTREPTIENRRARHDYAITDTLECGMKLVGTEVKAIRNGQASLAEGYVRATEQPPSLILHSVHIGEYPPAGAHQHLPIRNRTLLAHKREILKLARKAREKGVTLVPLKIYFKNNRAKMLIGVGQGKRRADKRQDIAKRDAKRDMDRAMSKRLGG